MATTKVNPEKSIEGPWPRWRASEEGQRCADISTLTGEKKAEYLDNRLWQAFIAGRSSQ